MSFSPGGVVVVVVVVCMARAQAGAESLPEGGGGCPGRDGRDSLGEEG